MRLDIVEEHCWGCKTCEVACKQENQVPYGVKLIRVREEGPEIVEGRWHFIYRIDLCRHCEDPPCATVCPAEAIEKREDGIVVLKEEECSGCRACLEACPYGAIDFDEKAGIAMKCNLCYHRLDQGLKPACADNVCLAHCIRGSGLLF